MSKRIRGLVGKLGVLALLVTYVLTGCGGKAVGENIEAHITQNESLPVSEKDIAPDEKINTIEGMPGTDEGNKVKEQMTKGLSNMEVIKIKEAFHCMIQDIEGQILLRDGACQNAIDDLQSIYNIAIHEPFKEDLLTMQKLLQHDLDNGDQTGQDYVKHMLNDLTFFGMDHPYNTYSTRAMGDGLELDTKLTFNKATKTWGDNYHEQVEEMTKGIEARTTEVFDLRTYANQLDLLIENELSKKHRISSEELIGLTLDISTSLQDVRRKLKESASGYENLSIEVGKMIEPLNEKFEVCINGLQNGQLKVEYMRAFEMLNHCHKESNKIEYDYTAALSALIETQEIIDDIYLILNTSSGIANAVNVQYSAATTLLEGYPVSYDFLKYEFGGDYPDGGTPAKNYFGHPLYGEPKGIVYPKDFDTKNPFVVSTMTLGKLFETYHITNEGKKVPNVSKQEERQELEQKYKGENIPVDESEVISLRASDIFAPNGLDIEIFNAYPNIKIDAIGMVDLSRLHIRFKGDNLEGFNMYLKTPTSPSPLPSFEWFSDIYEGEQYWNAVFFEISEPEELEEAYLVLETGR